MSKDLKMNGERPDGVNPSVNESEEKDMSKDKKVEERGAWGGMLIVLCFFNSSYLYYFLVKTRLNCVNYYFGECIFSPKTRPDVTRLSLCVCTV